MLPIAIFAILGLSLFMMGGDDVADDTDDAPTPEPDDAETVPVDSIYDDPETGGDGDDIIRTDSVGATFYGGNGDDVMTAETTPYNSSIYGGAGDDVITNLWSHGTKIYGGDGSDTITTGYGAQDGKAQIYGGADDDLIDARGGGNSNIYGGDGNDTILTSEGGQDFAGSYFYVNGGDGDDVFIHESTDDPRASDPVKLHGGGGNDRFEISLTENYDIERGEFEFDINGMELDYSSSHTVTLADFEPGSDTIQIDLDVSDPSYSVTSASLVEVGDKTQLTLRYDSATAVNREMIVEINATGVTWDDVTFVGDNIPPVLVPV